MSLSERVSEGGLRLTDEISEPALSTWIFCAHVHTITHIPMLGYAALKERCTALSWVSRSGLPRLLSARVQPLSSQTQTGRW